MFTTITVYLSLLIIEIYREHFTETDGWLVNVLCLVALFGFLFSAILDITIVTILIRNI